MNEQLIRRDIIVIGGSAGAVALLLALFNDLPKELDAAFFVVVHRSPHFGSQLGALIQRRTGMSVREPTRGEPVRAGNVYVAPRDQHMRIHNSSIVVDRGAKEHFTRPAVDPLFVSAATAYGSRVAGLVFSGGGADGATGLIAIKQAGGLSLVQDPEEAKHPSMPATGIVRDNVDAVLASAAIPAALTALIHGNSYESRTQRP